MLFFQLHFKIFVTMLVLIYVFSNDLFAFVLNTRLHIISVYMFLNTYLTHQEYEYMLNE